jgi:hypothetical protein
MIGAAVARLPDSGVDLECLDRVYLNGYVPNLQVGGQVVKFLTHRGFPIPSPVLLERNGLRFRRAVESYAQANGIPWVRFGKGERKVEVMRPYLDRLIRGGRCGVAAIGVAQEFQRVFTGTTSRPEVAAPLARRSNLARDRSWTPSTI